MVYDYGTDASTTKGIELSKDEEKTFINIVCVSVNARAKTR